MMKPDRESILACAPSLETMSSSFDRKGDVLLNGKFDRLLNMLSSSSIDRKQWYFTTSTGFSCSRPAAISLHTTIPKWHHTSSWLITDEPGISISSLNIMALKTIRFIKANLICWISSNQITANCLIEGLPSFLGRPAVL